jgi:hypothetical protein
MKWYKSFQKQSQECHKTGNRFTMKLPQYIPDKINTGYDIIVCIPFQTFCHSKACFEMRKKEGIE